MNGQPLATQLPDAIAEAVGRGPETRLESYVGGLVGGALIVSVILTNAAVAGPWAKRRLYSSFIDKVGPNRHGPAGLLIIVADSVGMLSKELVIPERVDRPAFDIAPVIMAAAALTGFAVIPFGTMAGIDFQLADPSVGLAFVFAFASMASLGLVMAGYASSNKFSFLGGAIVATLFLGGPAEPVLPGPAWMFVKIWGVFLFTQVARMTLPRLRIDQVLELGWKGLLVAAFGNFVLTAVIIGIA